MNIGDKIRKGKLTKAELIELMSDKLERDINNPARFDRNAFFKISGLTGLTAALFAACKKNPIIPDPPDIPITYNGYMQGLFTNSDITSGQLIFDGTTKVDISNGVYTILTSHNLTEGNHDVRIETNEGIPRETRANLSSRGLYQVKTGLAINNVIEKNLIDINTYNDFITADGSERWLTYKPKFFLYDNTLFEQPGDRSKLIVVDDDYTVDPTTISSIETVVRNHVSQYTANFVNNPVLLKESNSSERPDPNNFPKGWIIYLINRDALFDITASCIPNNGDIYYGEMAFQPFSATIAPVSIDIAQILGIGQQHNVGQILNGLNPSDLAQKVAKIIYNRAPHHNLHSGVDRE